MLPLKKYFTHLDDLPSKTKTEFEKIENIITLHLDFVKEMRRRLKGYLTEFLEAGIAKGEFYSVPVVATVNLIITLIKGLIRQRSLKLEEVKGMKETAVEFCRRSLEKKSLNFNEIVISVISRFY